MTLMSLKFRIFVIIKPNNLVTKEVILLTWPSNITPKFLSNEQIDNHVTYLVKINYQISVPAVHRGVALVDVQI